MFQYFRLAFSYVIVIKFKLITQISNPLIYLHYNCQMSNAQLIEMEINNYSCIFILHPMYSYKVSINNVQKLNKSLGFNTFYTAKKLSIQCSIKYHKIHTHLEKKIKKTFQGKQLWYCMCQYKNKIYQPCPFCILS